jgi:hypothetical protein
MRWRRRAVAHAGGGTEDREDNQKADAVGNGRSLPLYTIVKLKLVIARLHTMCAVRYSCKYRFRCLRSPCQCRYRP